ncbi:hypothetical protein RHABOEDO_000356 [Candidatus Rhabdochlamydia oedothoracis]|uniref:Transposase IS4-like domain-containing protein n=1 Tax=Candidatus Rhabdochlamydia oedothoracis TaxID=2720720 RepID=A0ABX8V5C4_9BACT|nr:hypothetical protein RHOW815_000449 [Candidatus Rhabdochlamydia sp. W815]QYF48233.1 hypothetical protein RHABOEDO_000356 [Candidatus Rhabdochlamydia oedothoracis]
MFGVKNVLADGGYSGEKFAKSVQEILGCIVEIAKRNTLHTFTVIPKRWVVERSFVWIEKCRRLWKIAKENYYKPEYGGSCFYCATFEKILNRL